MLKAAPFIGDQRGVLLKALCKPIFVERSRDKDFEAYLRGRGSEGVAKSCYRLRVFSETEIRFENLTGGPA